MNNKMNLFATVWICFDPIMTLVDEPLSVAIVWFGAHLISSGNLQIGNMMALFGIRDGDNSFLRYRWCFIMVPRAAVSVRRVGEALLLYVDYRPEVAEKLPDRGKIEFKDVTFTYPDADLPARLDINFVAEPGQTTAFIAYWFGKKSTR